VFFIQNLLSMPKLGLKMNKWLNLMYRSRSYA